MRRVGLFCVVLVCEVLACFVATQPAWAGQPDFHLQVVPAIIYKVDDPGSTKTSSFVFDVAVICFNECALNPISASVDISNGRSIVDRQEWTSEQLEKIKSVKYRIMPDTPIAAPRRIFTLPEAFDLHFYYRYPQALSIDSVNLRVKVADAKGHRVEQELSIPVLYYKQKTALIVPFRGLGVVGQDWITNGGHNGGIGTDFAVDMRGLEPNYAEQKSDSDESTAAAGWGREIIAPAAGTVTYARSDVPDNAHAGEPDVKSLGTLHDPVMAYMGNCVVIDHGNSEYSVLMHLQKGSVTVKVGDRVTSGQVIGKLGNSGDSYGPHLHYQFQSGPRVFYDQSLPFMFQNVENPQLTRGTFLDPK